MRKLIIVSVLLFGYYTQAQEIAGTTELPELDLKKHKSEIFDDVEKPAEFSEGINGFRRKLLEKLKVKNIVSQGIEKCELMFVIERDGTLTGITANGTNESFNNEAIRAVSKIKGKWIPATLNGQKVRYRFRVPLTLNFN
ncbi:energy transducer TonB [Chryseobacterium sp. Ch-15]|uniref:Energy transducer TonB n=1 Tax=Chryseobacterium muglaense TaxID=2893752 RepID=A0A9Q3UXJ9_9FLAO|nr:MULTISPECIES: energy transducer TonB [Chryseobacterium]MBD3904959.1 energy transducer TonB [Chryseobacterium muglaense]MBO6184964.1 energy transducer TonB [Chryseobacterium sp.]MCC9035174.1 energy transducer TonB [Chryseobacterium muglaense]MCM2554673.1 energy transducer TonB [Chryseobacterium muglaense]